MWKNGAPPASGGAASTERRRGGGISRAVSGWDAQVATSLRRVARLGWTREQRHGREHRRGSCPARRLSGEPAAGASPHTAARRTRRQHRPARGA